MRLNLWLCLAALATTVGCKTIDKDGFTIIEHRWTKFSEQVSTRAAFDFQCPKEDLTLTALDEFPRQIGAAGCGKHGVYVLSPVGGFVLNSAVTENADSPR